MIGHHHSGSRVIKHRVQMCTTKTVSSVVSLHTLSLYQKSKLHKPGSHHSRYLKPLQVKTIANPLPNDHTSFFTPDNPLHHPSITYQDAASSTPNATLSLPSSHPPSPHFINQRQRDVCYTRYRLNKSLPNAPDIFRQPHRKLRHTKSYQNN